MKMNSQIFTGVGVFIALAWFDSIAANSASENISVYGKYDDSQCEYVKELDDEGEYIERCKTTAGIDVFIRRTLPPGLHADRYHIAYGPSGEKQTSLRQSIEYIREITPVVEFRMKKSAKQPIAAIQRVRVAIYDLEDKESLTQVLIVTKIESDEACHMAHVYVNDHPNANEVAREVADSMAETFNCGRDKVKRIEKGKTAL
jgi:hypothetical protein